MMGSRTVQIDHMKSADTMSLQLQGHFHGIFVVHLLAVIIALGKAYTFPSIMSIAGISSIIYLQFDDLQFQEIPQNTLSHTSTLFRMELCGVVIAFMQSGTERMNVIRHGCRTIIDWHIETMYEINKLFFSKAFKSPLFVRAMVFHPI